MPHQGPDLCSHQYFFKLNFAIVLGTNFLEKNAALKTMNTLLILYRTEYR